MVYLQSDPSTSEDFDLIFSVEDEDIFPDVKKAAAFEAADVAAGLTEGVFSVWFAPEESGTELPEFWGCWLLLFSVKPEPDTVAELAVVFPVGWSGSGWLAITVEASVAVVVWVTDEVEFVASSWIGLKEAPTSITRCASYSRIYENTKHWFTIHFFFYNLQKRFGLLLFLFRFVQTMIFIIRRFSTDKLSNPAFFHK